MKQVELNKLMDLIDDIKKIDSMILLHQQLDDSDFMSSQYLAKKNRLVGKFIDELVSPSIQSEQSFHLIQEIIVKFYPSSQNGNVQYDKQLGQLFAAM